LHLQLFAWHTKVGEIDPGDPLAVQKGGHRVTFLKNDSLFGQNGYLSKHLNIFAQYPLIIFADIEPAGFQVQGAP